MLNLDHTARSFWTIVLLLLSACSALPPQTDDAGVLADAPPANNVTIRKSPNDDRDYRYLVLPNKLRMVLVSDPSTEKAAAALAVYRGSFHEPENRAGLAHFLEHMLFIQTQTYPEIDGFQHFINANGGSSNAYTALDHTNYFFDIQPSGFREGLDRFAHFFIDPVLSAEYSAREKNAVHSEYQMQIKDDGWRGYMTSKQTLNPAHPGSRFTIGSLDTLAGDIHEDLVDFFERQYSADQMGLVAISNESLDAMQAWIVPLFSQIENKDIGPAYPDMPMYTETQLPARLAYQTQKDGAEVSFIFPLPSARAHYQNKPEQYLSNLIGHEGDGSLYQLLNSFGWIESLGAGINDQDHNTSALSVNVELTPEGRKHVPEITDLLFRYIDLIKATPPQAWLYDEQARVAELGFRFQEKSRPTGLVYQLAPRLDEYPPEDLLVAPFLMQAFDSLMVEQLLADITPDNMLVVLAAADIEGTDMEPWFQVPYTLTYGPAARASIDDLENALAQLALPQPNPYLPDDLDLRSADDTPIAAAVEQPGLTLWTDVDVSFGSPRANLFLQVAVEGGLVSPTDRAAAQLYRLLVQDALSAVTYPAYLAGLGYSFSVPDSGFEIQIGGYADKQPVLLSTVLGALLDLDIAADRFAALKDSLLKDWRNAAKERPFRQAFAALDDTLRDGRWPRPMLIEALEPLTLNDLLAWREQKLSAVAVRGLLHGNVDAAEIKTLQQQLHDALPLANVAFTPPSIRSIEQPLRLQLPVDHNDASMVIHVQDADDSFPNRALSALAAQILHQAYFQELRTEQQLGYVVSVSNRPIGKRGGLSFIVQSPNTSAAALEQATLTFLDAFLSQWTTMTEAEFALHKSGLITRLLESPKNLNEASARYWRDLTDDYLSFDSRQQVAAEVEALTQSEVYEFLRQVQEALATRRLLIFTQGQFADIPTHGHLLQHAKDTLPAPAETGAPTTES